MTREYICSQKLEINCYRGFEAADFHYSVFPLFSQTAEKVLWTFTDAP